MLVAQFKMPFPPSVNHIYGRGPRGVYLKKEARAYHEKVRAAVVGANCNFPMQGNFIVKMTVHVPNNRRRDLDNLLKVTFDSLTRAGVWEDDRWIVGLEVYKGEPDPKKEGYLDVRIFEL